MNQEITISTTIIDYFAKNLPAYLDEKNAQKIIKLLRENYCTVDERRDLFKKIWDETNNIINEQLKRALQDFVEWWFTQHVSVIKSNFICTEMLASSSKDKIFLSPLITNKQKRKIQIKYGVEAHNEISFINPEITNRLKHNSTVLKFEHEVQYDFATIIEPYLRRTTKVIIEDPYMANPNALNNLKIIISSISCKEIILKVYNERMYAMHAKNKRKKGENYKDYIEFINKFKSKYLIEVLYYKNIGHKERYIITDNTKIILPGGLDFLDEDGKITSTENTVEIVVKPNEQFSIH